MARLYANENFPLPVVQALRKLGHDVRTIQEAGMANRKVPDPEVLRLSHTDKRAVLTINRKDFRRLHRQSQDHSGIIICTSDLDFNGQATRIDTAIRSSETLASQLIWVNRPASNPI